MRPGAYGAYDEGAPHARHPRRAARLARRAALRRPRARTGVLRLADGRGADASGRARARAWRDRQVDAAARGRAAGGEARLPPDARRGPRARAGPGRDRERARRRDLGRLAADHVRHVRAHERRVGLPAPSAAAVAAGALARDPRRPQAARGRVVPGRLGADRVRARASAAQRRRRAPPLRGARRERRAALRGPDRMGGGLAAGALARCRERGHQRQRLAGGPRSR